MTPHPWEDGDNPYGTEGGASRLQHKQEYPIESEHVYVEVLQSISAACRPLTRASPWADIKVHPCMSSERILSSYPVAWIALNMDHAQLRFDAATVEAPSEPLHEGTRRRKKQKHEVTGTSQVIPQPTTAPAQASLTSQIERDGV